MKPSRSLHALLANSIDYAGLFPPSTLELEPALKNFASYVRSDDAWMLSTFVLPIAKFAEAARLASEFSEKYPLTISALGPKTMNETDFAEEWKNVEKGIRELTAEGRNFVRVDQVEMPLPTNFDTGIFAHTDKTETAQTVGEAASFPYKSGNSFSSKLGDRSRDLPVFWEAPVDDAERVIAVLGEHNAASRTSPISFKLRTGGVTADAFPSSAQIARALVASAKHMVPTKFTAGLHHPVRMFRDEVKTKMHGFLNVLGAGVLAIEHKWNEEQTIAMLDDEDASAFMFTNEAFRWRDSQVAMERIIEHRKFVTSFGSCSFDEPREDLRALKLL